MFTKILVASDGSECALKAAHDAVMMASKFGVRLTALYVFSVPATVATFGGAQMGTVDPR